MNLFTLYKRAIGLLAAAPKSAADPEPTCRPPGGPLIVPQHSRVFRMRWTPPQSAPESALGVKRSDVSNHPHSGHVRTTCQSPGGPEAKLQFSDNRAAAYEPQSAIFPGYQAPVVRAAADGERELVVLNWGFVLLQKDRAPRRVTNVRDDKILESKFWRPSFEQRRCLVPASSYCEPKGEKPATWHWFSINGDDARPPFAFPGVWQPARALTASPRVFAEWDPPFAQKIALGAQLAAEPDP